MGWSLYVDLNLSGLLVCVCIPFSSPSTNTLADRQRFVSIYYLHKNDTATPQ